MDNTANNIVGRFTNATNPNVTSNGGSLNFLANNSPGTSSAETLGQFTLSTGQTTINTGYNTATPVAVGSTLTFNSLVRNIGATVNFIGGTGNDTPLGIATNGANNFLIVNGSAFTSVNGTAGTFSANGYQYFGNGNNGTGTSTGVGNIIPFAVSNGGNTNTDFASYSANGITAYANTAAGRDRYANGHHDRDLGPQHQQCRE